MNKLRILIVDDEADMCEFLTEAVSPFDCEVRSTRESEQAIGICKDFMPHIVLLDVMMPKMNGIEVLQKIREYDKQVNVIMISGMLDLGLAREAMSLGAIDYLAKPIDLTKLGELIESAKKETFGA